MSESHARFGDKPKNPQRILHLATEVLAVKTRTALMAVGPFMVNQIRERLAGHQAINGRPLRIFLPVRYEPKKRNTNRTLYMIRSRFDGHDFRKSS